VISGGQTPAHPAAMAPPRGAALAGVIFALLAIVGLGLVRYAIPADASKPSVWLTEPHRLSAVRLALDLVPFAGIAFLWFVGVLRNRLGEPEDRFFATLFLGSGLLFVASLFGAAAVTDALIESAAAGRTAGETYYFGRTIGDSLLNLFAMKMAGVFIFSTCTLGLRTAIFPRWIAYAGYICGLMLLLIIANWRWIALIFPLWMLVVGGEFLWAEWSLRRRRPAAEPG
jgi:hypothetical protein